jgi:gliding motility-associated-like protein
LQQIICVPVVMGAGCTAGNLTQFQLGAGSSSNLAADVSKIHIFYTGTSNVYTASNEFVVGGTAPTGASNTIIGSQALVPNATNYFWVTYDMNPTSTLGNIIDGSCTQITIGGSNYVPTTTNPAGSGTIVSCPCSFSLGSDVTLCAPFTYTLNGPGGFDTYTWTPSGATTQNLVVNSPGTYTCSATLINGGLVTNGNFSSGNTGFTTSYALGTGGTWGALSNEGTYSVTTNPNLAHSNFYSFGDHTTGTGNMLVCNGSSIANTVVWSQTITVTPNTVYNFSAWVASVENTTSEAQLQFSINGNLIGPVVNAPLTGATWLNFFVNWNSGTNTSAVIKIVDQSTEVGGNDFALDDITFERVCTFSDVITINAGSTATVSVPSNVTVCNSGTVAASTFTSSTAGVTYSWTNSNPSIGLAASGTSNTPVFTAVNTGTAPIVSVISVTPAVGTCTGTPNSYTVIVNPNPVVSVNSPTTCSGVSAILSASGATSYSWNTGATTSTISVTPISNTIYTVVGTTNGCTTTVTSSVSVSSALSISINNATICAGTSTILTATGATNYTWTTGATTSSINVSPVSLTTYSVVGETAGCTGTTSASVYVNSTPTLSVNNPTLCQGENATLTANGANSYTWSTGSTAQTITVSPTGTTTYTVSGEVSSCIANTVVTVSVNALPTISVNNATICSGSSAILTASGGASYTWTPGLSATNTIAVSPTITTTYSVVGTDGNCFNTSTGVVTVTSCTTACTFTLANDVSMCLPLSYTINGPVGYNSYSWTPGGATTQNLSVSSPGTYTCTAYKYSNDLVDNGNFSSGNTGFSSNYVVPGSPGAWGLLTNPGTYAITTNPNLVHNNFHTFGDHTSGNGNMMVCNGSTIANDVVWTQTISVNPNTDYNFSAWAASVWGPLTSGDEARLQFSINGTLVGSVFNLPLTSGTWANFFVNWNSGANTSAVITIVDQNITAPGANDFALDDIFFQEICSHSDDITISVLPSPTVSVLATNSVVCSGDITTLTASGANTYVWSNGVLNGVAFTPTTTATYTVLGTSAQGCSNTAVQTVTVNNTPTLTVNNATICYGSSVILNATGANSYTWSASAGSVNTASASVNPTATTIYSVSGENSGCLATTSATVNVNTVPVLSVNAATICSGQNAQLTATTSLSGGTYVWTPGNQNSSTINVTPLGTSNYSVSYSVNGCSTTAISNVSVNPVPFVSVSSVAICEGQIATLTATPSLTGGTFLWTPTGQTASTISDSPQSSSSYQVLYSLNGCTTSAVGIVTVNPLPIVVLSASSQTITSLEEVLVSASGGGTYLWNTGETSSSITVNPQLTTTYCATVTSVEGCSNNNCVTVFVKDISTLYVPNVFTPNNDGVNDMFFTPNTHIVKYDLTIFNRWGQLLFSSEDPLKGWDGTFNGQIVPDGVYVYILNAKGADEVVYKKTGHITIIK